MGSSSAVVSVVFTPKSSTPILSRSSVFCSKSLHRKLYVSISQTSSVKKSVKSGKFLFGCSYSISTQCNSAEPSDDEFVVVNFYHFMVIKDPEAEVAKHLSFLEGLDIHGRVYLNEQGINAQYSGPSKDALAYVEWLKEDHRFSNILVQISPALKGHAFPRLKLRYKPSLVQLEGGISHLPLLDPSMRATPIGPSEWRKRLEAINGTEVTSNEDSKTNYILLDVRNGSDFLPEFSWVI